MDLSEQKQLEVVIEKTAADYLRAARALIADESRWIQGELERNGKFCVEGAFNWVTNGSPFQDYYRKPEAQRGWDLLVRSAEMIYNMRPCEVNDARGHAAALQLFDRAIALAAL